MYRPFLLLILFLTVPWAAAGTDDVLEAATPLAMVDGEPLTREDLLAFVRRSPSLRVYLTVPNGPEKLLDMLIQHRLLLREGARQDIEAPDGMRRDGTAYAAHVEQQLLADCEVADESSLEAFHERNPRLFSTPLMVRLSRIAVNVDDAAEADAAELRLTALRAEIDAGERAFAEAAAEHNEDPLGQGRGGDIGFIPVESEDHPLWQQLTDAAIGTLVGPVREHGMISLYKITDRYQPILANYDEIRQQVRREYLQDCRDRSRQQLLADLRQRWPVEILADELSTAFEPRR
ncbi:MAG: peptidylprolyl isomerase [Candidatus Competibacterales bacterium]|nr:peptidylprolyl isomerase [Candidatus Competibacterales bacterium]